MRYCVRNIDTNEIVIDSFQDNEKDLPQGTFYVKRKYPVDLKYKMDPYFYQLFYKGDKLFCKGDLGYVNIGFNNDNVLELKYIKDYKFGDSECHEGMVFEPNTILYLNKVNN